jgi:Arc/MetJ family transcription regulator
MEKRTNIVLDDKLIRQGMKATGIKTQRALVHHALEELVRREKQMGLLKLEGKIKWTGDLNKMRRYRFA